MSPSISTPDLRGLLTEHLARVFATMLGLPAVPVESAASLGLQERVSGVIGLGGEQVKGALYLHLSVSFAAQAAATMLGLNPGELPSGADLNDVVGELTNMVGGGLKSALCDHGTPCAMSTPSIIRGTAFLIEPLPEVERTELTFSCGAHQVVLELHFQSVSASAPL